MTQTIHNILWDVVWFSCIFSFVFGAALLHGGWRASRWEKKERLRKRLEFVTTCNKLGIDPDTLARSAFEHGEFTGEPSVNDIVDRDTQRAFAKRHEIMHNVMQRTREMEKRTSRFLREAKEAEDRRRERDRAFARGKRTAIGLINGKAFKPCPYHEPHMIEAWERGYRTWSRLVSLKTEGEK